MRRQRTFAERKPSPSVFITRLRRIYILQLLELHTAISHQRTTAGERRQQATTTTVKAYLFDHILVRARSPPRSRILVVADKLPGTHERSGGRRCAGKGREARTLDLFPFPFPVPLSFPALRPLPSVRSCAERALPPLSSSDVSDSSPSLEPSTSPNHWKKGQTDVRNNQSSFSHPTPKPEMHGHQQRSAYLCVPLGPRQSIEFGQRVVRRADNKFRRRCRGRSSSVGVGRSVRRRRAVAIVRIGRVRAWVSGRRRRREQSRVRPYLRFIAGPG